MKTQLFKTIENWGASTIRVALVKKSKSKNITTYFLLSAFAIVSLIALTSLKQTPKTKPAYCLFDNVQITDTTKLQEYKNQIVPVVEKFGGRYVVAGGQLRKIEGNWNPHFLIMIEFQSYEQANKWYDSDEYRELKMLRLSSGKFEGIIIEGL